MWTTWLSAEPATPSRRCCPAHAGLQRNHAALGGVLAFVLICISAAPRLKPFPAAAEALRAVLSLTVL